MRQRANKLYAAVMHSPIGALGLRLTDNHLTHIDMLGAARQTLPRKGLAAECVSQLRSYFQSPSFRFDVPIWLEGTPHQLCVWQALQAIECGATLSYGELAGKLGSGPRAVGNACRRNPLPIIVPCHRVIAANGPGGYAGAVKGAILNRKLWLLQHEAGARTDI
jgi:methylated-DNA-[protein]-cysteine S-methyltransferase